MPSVIDSQRLAAKPPALCAVDLRNYLPEQADISAKEANFHGEPPPSLAIR
jgi:hypothetical protein